MSNRLKDQDRFAYTLEEVNELGGGMQLLSWSGNNPKMIPETSADYGDITTTIRDHVMDNPNKGLVIRVAANGRGAEIFYAKFEQATREPFDGERGLGQDAMDTLVFEDGSSYHFDKWSDGKPYKMVSKFKFVESPKIERILRFIFGNPETRIARNIIIASLPLITISWWEPYAEHWLSEYLSMDPTKFDALELYPIISGWVLFSIGIWLYLKKSR